MSQTTKVLLAFTGVFVAGAVAGGIVALRVGVEQAQAVKQISAGSQPAAPTQPKVTTVTTDNFAPMQLRQLTSQLKLTAAQKEQIQPIIEVAGEKISKLSQESRAATNALIEAMGKDVALLLTPEQAKTFADLQSKRAAQFNNRFNRPSGGGPDRGGFRGGGPNGGSGQMPGRPPHRQGGSPDAPPPTPGPAT
jgi:Spy/CpxP family protein refolding chaperone